MTKAELLEFLTQNGITTAVYFENAAADGYFVLKNKFSWEVSLRERGVELDCMGFPTEEDALAYLAQKLLGKEVSL